MSTLVFRGVFLRHFDFRKEEAGWYVRMHLTAEYSSVVADAMDWPTIPPEGVNAGDLDGELVAQSLEFVPNEKGMKSHRLEIDVNQVSDFQFVRVTEDDSTRVELRFKARSPVDGAEGILGAFARRVGQSCSQLTVSYHKQENLPLEKTA